MISKKLTFLSYQEIEVDLKKTLLIKKLLIYYEWNLTDYFYAFDYILTFK